MQYTPLPAGNDTATGLPCAVCGTVAQLSSVGPELPATDCEHTCNTALLVCHCSIVTCASTTVCVCAAGVHTVISLLEHGIVHETKCASLVGLPPANGMAR